MDELGINPRILAFLVLFGLLALVSFGGGFLFPPKSTLKESTEPEEMPLIVERYVTVLVTPTPDGHIYFATEYQDGIRQLSRPYSWIRNNVTGQKDMKVTVIVYDYKFFDKLHWFNPAEYKYHEAVPDTPGYKWLLIFPYMFMDDIVGDDTRMWAFNRSQFAVQAKGQVYFSKEYPYQLRFKELETTRTFNNDYYVQAFKSFRAYSDFQERPDLVKSAGEYNDERYYLRGGRSNALDGYILFEVPADTKPEDCLVLTRFYSFGNPMWKLVT